MDGGRCLPVTDYYCRWSTTLETRLRVEFDPLMASSVWSLRGVREVGLCTRV
uniref:Uncharacterized protein n=1 Tax=Cucumis melo TaxID=3656 RepID=A0A9I9DCU5_CUCME